MASQTRQREREEASRLSLRTLVIASVASATAAVVTSQFWARGTWIAAAMTPVIVALVQELLHRPTEKIATALTSDREALVPRPRRRAHAGVREELGAPSEVREAEAGERAARREAERSARAAKEAPVQVYRRGGPSRPRRRRIAIGAVAVTAFLAFAVAAVALTVPELITGQSIGKGDRGTTLFGGQSHKKSESATPTQTETAPKAQPPAGQQTQETQPQQQTQETQPQETTTQPSPRASPQQTQTQPSP
jgi:hypothetical protein